MSHRTALFGGASGVFALVENSCKLSLSDLGGEISELHLTQGHAFSTIQRQRHRKHRPFTHLALNRDLSTQKICELLDNRESQTGSSIISCCRTNPRDEILQRSSFSFFFFNANSRVRPTNSNDAFCYNAAI